MTARQQSLSAKQPNRSLVGAVIVVAVASIAGLVSLLVQISRCKVLADAAATKNRG